MKVLRNTTDQLILENSPLWLAILVSACGLVFVAIGLAATSLEPFFGLAFVVGGLGVAIGFNMIFVRRTQLILDRARNLATLRRKSWLGYHAMTWKLGHVDRAVVQGSQAGASGTTRAALVIAGGMDAGTHPITIVYSSGGGAKHAADAINDWLATLDRPTPSA